MISSVEPYGNKWVVQRPDGRMHGPFPTVEISRQYLDEIEGLRETDDGWIVVRPTKEKAASRPKW